MLQKAKSPELIRLEQLLATQERRVRLAFAEFLKQARSDAVLAEARRLLARRDIEGALRLIDPYVVRFGAVIPRIWTSAGGQEMKALQQRLRAAEIGVAFEAGLPRAAELIRANQLLLIREFGESQREAVRAALSAGLEAGFNPLRMATTFRNAIGLTSTQLSYIDNYRRLLEAGSAEALDRDLRDRRFDRTVATAIDDGRLLTPNQVERMVGSYQDRMLIYRSENISRTEALRAVSQARQEALEQLIEQTDIDPIRVERVWQSTQDRRTRDTHAAMDGQVRGLTDPFESPSGELLMYPGDPNASGSETINCRCVLLTRLK